MNPTKYRQEQPIQNTARKQLMNVCHRLKCRPLFTPRFAMNMSSSTLRRVLGQLPGSRASAMQRQLAELDELAEPHRFAVLKAGGAVVEDKQLDALAEACASLVGLHLCVRRDAFFVPIRAFCLFALACSRVDLLALTTLLFTRQLSNHCARQWTAVERRAAQRWRRVAV